MTVIASFDVNGYPVVFGDLLVSGLEDESRSLSTPTIHQITKIFPKGSGFVPTALKQKVTSINENLMVAWSGSSLGARVVLNALIKESETKSIWSKEDLSGFLKNFDGTYGNEIGLVGFSRDIKGIFSFGYGLVSHYSSAKYGLVRLSGTGAEDLKEYLEKDFSVTITGKVNPLENAIARALVICGHLTGLESVSGNSLINYYGGGFEIAAYFKGKFQKIDDVTYLVWHGKRTKGGWELSLPRIVLKYAYYDNVLLIKRGEFVSSPQGVVRLENESCHYVGSIYQAISQNEINNAALPSFNSRLICSFILLTCDDGSMCALTRINYSGQGNNPIQFSDERTSTMGLNIRKDFLESVQQEISQMMPSK